MSNYLPEFLSDGLESVSGWYNEYVDPHLGKIDELLGIGRTAYEQEAAKDPEVLKRAEPVKGRNKDGSTVVAQPSVQMPFSQNTMIFGGIGAAIILVLLLRK